MEIINKFKILKEKDLEATRLAWLFFGCFLMFEFIFLKSDLFDSIIFLYDKQDLAYTIIFILFTAVLMYCLLNFFVIAFSSDWKYKLIYFLFFTVVIAYEYGYQKALGRFSSLSDIEDIFASNLGHKVSALSSYISLLGFLPCVVFLICLIIAKTEVKPQKLKSFLGILAVSAFLYIQLSFATVYFIERKFPITSIDAFCRASTDFMLWGSFSNSILKERIILKKPPLEENHRPNNNIIFVVDESTRGDHLSLNGYTRKTTPFLDELQSKGILHNWGISASATTGSRATYDTLVSGLTPDDFPDKTNVQLFTSPSIFQYAKAMNYKTHHFDGQMSSFWGGISDDKQYFDSWQGANQLRTSGSSNIDRDIAKEVNKLISTSTGNFIFIFKHGNHIPYSDNFPAEETVWKPSYVSNNKFEIPPPEKLDEVINSYDNSIKYNTDSFFQNLIADYNAIPNNTVIIYTGDHGQSLYANGKASHGGYTRVEANVPIFIVGNLGTEVDTNYKASHSNLFATILDLMSFPEDLRFRKYSPSLLKAKANDSKMRYFNPDKGEKIPFD